MDVCFLEFLKYIRLIIMLKNIDMKTNFGYNSLVGRLSNLFCKNILNKNSGTSSCLGQELSFVCILL